MQIEAKRWKSNTASVWHIPTACGFLQTPFCPGPHVGNTGPIAPNAIYLIDPIPFLDQMPYFCLKLIDMKKLVCFLCFGFLFYACDDGDIMDANLDFDGNLQFCDQSTTDYLLYNIRLNPFESLSLQFPISSATSQIFTTSENGYVSSFAINGSSVLFNYRTYDGNPQNLLCALLPDPNTSIIKDYSATSGMVYTITTFEDDDNDGIPNHIEDANLDGDNDPSTNPTDTDGDGIPDYMDADDDNDNILTKYENHGYTSENGLANAQDTDGDGIPDYLDDDDDGDGVPTRYEDENGDNNPRNDFDEASETPDIPRYLDPTATQSFPNDHLVPNVFTRNYKVQFRITDIDLQILSSDNIDFGNYEYSVTIE